MIPADPLFYLGFVFLLMVTAVVAVVGGNNGIAIGRLIQRSDWLARSSIRFLRLGMWLPFFVLWANPETLLTLLRNVPAVFRMVPFPIATGNEPGLSSLWTGGLLAVLTVLFGSCYYYLSSHMLTKSDAAQLRLHLHRSIFLLALFVCLLWQSFSESGWPWHWIWRVFLDTGRKGFAQFLLSVTITTCLPMFLLMIVVFVSNRVFQWSLDGTVESRQNLLSAELDNTTPGSLLGVLLLVVVALLLWLLLRQPLRTYLSIPPPSEVVQAMRSLLVTGTAAVNGWAAITLWPYIKLSLLEILGGIVWASLFAVPMVAICFRFPSLKPCGGLLALSCVSPIVLQAAAIIWFGVGALEKAIVVSYFAFFALVQALWSYRHLSLPPRLLIAIDEALPYAFVGMLTSETFASKEGLGFFMVAASLKQKKPEAFAACLILFGLLVAISGILRWMVKRAVTRPANDAAVKDGWINSVQSAQASDSMISGSPRQKELKN